jgi:hypothetical protein
MTIDIAGSVETAISAEQGASYVPDTRWPTYRATVPKRPRLTTRHASANIVVRDTESGREGHGPTYLDALRSLPKP